MEKRFQVFVSSTFTDLLDERRVVIEALLSLGCFPAGMELFPAADEDQWTLIKSVIDQCDYYLVILGGRYGSIGPEGKSFTRMEYEYALSRRLPVIAFVHQNPATLPGNRIDSDASVVRQLEEFRSLAKQRTVRFWNNLSELQAAVYQSMVHLMQRRPAVGWVRADAMVDHTDFLRLQNESMQVTQELERLKRVGISNAGIMPYSDVNWNRLFADSMNVDLMFAYARTWRKSHAVELNQLAKRENAVIRVLLPDPEDDQSVAELSCRLGKKDRADVEAFRERIFEAAADFITLSRELTTRATIETRFYPFAPQYTFYRFDSQGILCMGSHRTSGKRGVITFEVSAGPILEYAKEEFDQLFESRLGRPAMAEIVPQKFFSTSA